MATIDTNLIANILIESGEALAPKKAAPLKVFSRDFSDEVETYANGKFKTAKIAFTDKAPTVVKNPSAFGNDTDSNTTAVEVGIDLYSAPITANWNDPVSVKQYVQGALEALVQEITKTATSLITTSAFGVSRQVSVDIAGADTDAKQAQLMKTLYASTDSGVNKYLVADSGLYSCALPSNLNGFTLENGGFGFNGIYENNIWASDSTIKGIVTDGRALAMVARVPEWADEIKNGMTSENIYIPSLDLTVQFNKWADMNGRTVKGDLCVAFGASIYDKSATKVVLQSA